MHEHPNAAAIELANLAPLMDSTTGRGNVVVALIDGPVATGLPDFASGKFREVSGSTAACSRTSSVACSHGTFVAGILAATRGASSPAICPGCTFIVRPIFHEGSASTGMPAATPDELAHAVDDVLRAGAGIINLSAAITHPSPDEERLLAEVFNAAARRGVLVVAAAGNQGTLASTAITRHHWVIPVAACNRRAELTHESNIGSSVGRRGLRAPGDAIVSLAADGGTRTLGGTSVAAPFVTGTLALLASLFPSASAAELRRALLESARGARATVVPRLLDAGAAQRLLATAALN